jgi:hypothetical protein
MLSTLGNPSFGYKVLLPIIAILLAAPLLSGPGGTPPPGEEVMFDVTWGDDSGSQSESYTLSIPNAQPSTLPKSIPGELMTKPLALRKGKSYTLTMNHVRTTLKNAPDYDYTLRVDGKGGNVITVLDKGVGGTWLLYDKNSIGGVHSESNEFYAAGRELLLVPVDLDIVHPATGEFAENKENVGDGGYLSIERDATTPRTGLLIKSNTALGAAGGKYRLKFANGTRYHPARSQRADRV